MKAGHKFLALILLVSIIGMAGLPAPGKVSGSSGMTLDDVNSFLFTSRVTDTRNSRLISAIQPDFIHRGMFEWTGTPLADRQFPGAVDVLDELRQSSIVTGGISGYYWAPDFESGPATVDQATKNRASIPNTGFDNVVQINIGEQVALDQLIYRAKKQIDAGVDGIEFDEFGMGWPNYNQVKNALAYIRDELKSYALSQYNRDIYISTNSMVGGQDFPNFANSNNDGSEPVDFYLRNLPYRLVGLSQNDPSSNNDYDGAFNFIPALRQVHQDVWPKRFYYFVDFGSETVYWAPHKPAQWSNFYRNASAQVIAAGGFPGNFSSFYRNLDAYEMGIFQDVANIKKFMDEHGELWRNLTFVNPTVTASVSKVNSSVFEQTGRTILHLVNGDYSNVSQSMTPKSNFTVSIPLNTAPSRIWMTTPDKPSKDRKATVAYTWNSSTKVATLTIPQLDFHNVVVIEQGSTYDPTYAPLEVKFPFPNAKTIYTGNEFRVIAVSTDGRESTYNWYVNGILGGNSTVGTISTSGVYKAPNTVPSSSTVTIKAVSKVDTLRSNEFTLQIKAAASLPLSETFASDAQGQIPANWHIVDGRGDWQVALDGSTKVLSNLNISEGNGNGDNRETALYNPFITFGDQLFTNYEFKASVKLRAAPIKVNNQGYGTYVGLVFRYQNPDNYYFYAIEADLGARLYKKVNGVITEIGGARFTGLPSEQDYTKVSVQVRGSEFALKVGPRIVRTDTDTTFTRGAAGFKTSYTSSFFKDIAIQAVPQVRVDLIDNANGFTQLYERSADVAIDTANASVIGGDGSRFFRGSQTTAEYVTYELKGNNAAKVTTWFWPGEAINHFKFYKSNDNTNWTEVTPTITTTNATLPNWSRVVYEVTGLTGSTNYLRVQWQAGGSNHWTPQIGSVELFEATTFSFDEASVLPSLRSSNLGVDTSNQAVVGNDSSRFYRTSGTQAEWIVYSLNEIREAAVRTYFWPGEAISDFRFYVSADYVTWEEIIPFRTVQFNTYPNWHRIDYALDRIVPGYNYLKIEWQNLSGESWTPQIGRVEIRNAS